VTPSLGPSALATPKLRLAWGLVALALAACQLQVGPTAKARSAPAKPKALQATPAPDRPASAPVQADPKATSQAEASATPALALKLPLRLGTLLPISLVGEAGRKRLSGEDGQVAELGTEFYALADGRIISNHSGGLISDQGGGIISNHSGGLISDQGGGIVSNNSGSLISDQGGAYRLAQAAETTATGTLAFTRDTPATATHTKVLTDPRVRLWAILTSYDYIDQLMASFARQGPKLGRWRRFDSSQYRTLPMPIDVGLPVKELDQKLQSLHYAGVITRQGSEARLRVLWLPEAGAALADGVPVLDLGASGPGAMAHTRFPPPMEALFGYRNSANTVEVQPTALGRRIVSRLAETGDPQRSPTSISALISSKKIELTRRYLRFETHTESLASVYMATSEHQSFVGKPDRTEASRKSIAWGYDPRAKEDLGLAMFARSARDPASLGPLQWDLPFDEAPFEPGGALPVWPYFVLPKTGEMVQPGPANLRPFVPPFRPEDDLLVPPICRPDEDPALDPEVRLAPFPPALLALPEEAP
jgi:hypothetical protein